MSIHRLALDLTQEWVHRLLNAPEPFSSFRGQGPEMTQLPTRKFFGWHQISLSDFTDWCTSVSVSSRFHIWISQIAVAEEPSQGFRTLQGSRFFYLYRDRSGSAFIIQELPCRSTRAHKQDKTDKQQCFHSVLLLNLPGGSSKVS